MLAWGNYLADIVGYCSYSYIGRQSPLCLTSAPTITLMRLWSDTLSTLSASATLTRSTFLTQTWSRWLPSRWVEVPSAMAGVKPLLTNSTFSLSLCMFTSPPTTIFEFAYYLIMSSTTSTILLVLATTLGDYPGSIYTFMRCSCSQPIGILVHNM